MEISRSLFPTKFNFLLFLTAGILSWTLAPSSFPSSGIESFKFSCHKNSTFLGTLFFLAAPLLRGLPLPTENVAYVGEPGGERATISVSIHKGECGSGGYEIRRKKSISQIQPLLSIMGFQNKISFLLPRQILLSHNRRLSLGDFFWQ